VTQSWDWQIPLVVIGSLGIIGLLMVAVCDRALRPAPA
jgi:hypothetical protein